MFIGTTVYISRKLWSDDLVKRFVGNLNVGTSISTPLLGDLTSPDYMAKVYLETRIYILPS